jgi:hypothetical protein
MGSLKSLVIVACGVLAVGASPPPTTSLELEIYGAFSYVTVGPSHMEIAALETVKASTVANPTVCAYDVTQEGVDLFVESGTIVRPTPRPKGKIFDIRGALVSFPDLENTTGQLIARRPNTSCQTWDLSCVPSVSAESNTQLDPNWRTAVNAAVRLTRGTLVAGRPSDVELENEVFDFKRNAVQTNQVSQKITDRTILSAPFPGNRIVLELKDFKTGAAFAIPRIEIQPNGNRPVKLRLMARHSHNVPVSLNPGDPVGHYCAYYALRTPMLAPASEVIPHLGMSVNFTPAPPGSNAGGQASPGPYCPPDWP